MNLNAPQKFTTISADQKSQDIKNFKSTPVQDNFLHTHLTINE